MKILLTGAGGFVAQHLVAALLQDTHFGPSTDIVATARHAGRHPVLGTIEALDVTDGAAVQLAIGRHAPTHVVHLAAIAAPSAAGEAPDAAWRINVDGTLCVARAILNHAPECHLLHVGSGLIYGASAKSGKPLDETTLLAPMDEYAATKAAADLALGALARQGLKCIRLRPFNHTGPGQSEAFVVPGFAMQVARIEAGLRAPVIHVGNLEAERDFLDVRDIADAYVKAIAHAHRLQPGTILNVASGATNRIGEILDRLIALSRSSISIERDASRLRPNDVPRMAGDAQVARQCLGWAPQHSFAETIADVLADCRSRVAADHAVLQTS